MVQLYPFKRLYFCRKQAFKKMSFFKCQAYGRNASLALFSSLQVSDIDNSEKYLFCIMAFDLGLPGAQTVKRLSTMRETWVRSLGQEDSLKKEMATNSSTLA